MVPDLTWCLVTGSISRKVISCQNFWFSNFTDLRLKRFRLRFEDLDCDNISIKASHLVRVHLLQQLVCQHLWRGELREESVRYEVPDVSCDGREFRRWYCSILIRIEYSRVIVISFGSWLMLSYLNIWCSFSWAVPSAMRAMTKRNSENSMNPLLSTS